MLKDAVASVLAQTYGDFTYIIGSDGSTDRTREYVASIKDERVLFFDSAHIGQFNMVNTLLDMAKKFDYVAILSDDDWWEPTFLEKCLSVIDKDAVLVHTDYYTDTAGHRVHTLVSTCKRTEALSRIIDAGKAKIIINGSATVMNVRFLRALKERDGFIYDNSYTTAADYDLWIRLLELGPAKHICETLNTYRDHAGSISKTMAFHQFFQALDINKRAGLPIRPWERARSLLWLIQRRLHIVPGWFK
jgi:glycosyltransferase involved in cell wall biosynthesis